MTMAWLYFMSHCDPDSKPRECRGRKFKCYEMGDVFDPKRLCPTGRKLWKKSEEADRAQEEWRKTAPKLPDGGIDWDKIAKTGNRRGRPSTKNTLRIC